MQICLIRHGQTAGNALRRYIGSTDEPLSDRGIAEARAAGANMRIDEVYATPLLRTRQTAEILFPKAVVHTVSGLREMDFGDFENRSADEMENDAAYRAWVDADCIPPCPGGESMEQFRMRVEKSFSQIILRLSDEGADKSIFVVHGGTIMAVMSRFYIPARGYYDSRVKNCEGYCCTLSPGSGALPFTMTDAVPWHSDCI